MENLAVGIDLGTTNSVIASLDGGGRPTTLANEEGDAVTPSVVYFDKGGPLVGREAVKAAAFAPDRAVRLAKRDMGEIRCRKPIGGRWLPPEVVQSLVLAKLKRDGELKVGPIAKAVITVPAYFNEPRRKATQDAGRLAGLEVIDLINEPTAAAIAFGVEQGFLAGDGKTRQTEVALVYDLGGGTFDATIVEMSGGRFHTVATAGDVCLGGADWDERIADWLAERFQQEHGLQLKSSAVAWERLLEEAGELKKALSAREEATARLAHEGRQLQATLSRAEFESLSADLLERTRMTVKRLLREARLTWSDLTRLLLAGGATRMPMVRRMLEEESGMKADRSLSPDEAVAHGAAIYAGLLLKSPGIAERGVSVRNVNSHDLGVLGVDPQTGRPLRKVMIPRNTPLPASAIRLFETLRPGQREVVVKVIEGGAASGAGATLVGKCIVTGLPADLPAGSGVKVAFHYAQNGRLTVEASLPMVQRQVTLTIERASGLSDDDLQAWSQLLAAGLAMPDG